MRHGFNTGLLRLVYQCPCEVYDCHPSRSTLPGEGVWRTFSMPSTRKIIPSRQPLDCHPPITGLGYCHALLYGYCFAVPSVCLVQSCILILIVSKTYQSQVHVMCLNAPYPTPREKALPQRPPSWVRHVAPIIHDYYLHSVRFQSIE